MTSESQQIMGIQAICGIASNLTISFTFPKCRLRKSILEGRCQFCDQKSCSPEKVKAQYKPRQLKLEFGRGQRAGDKDKGNCQKKEV